MDTFNENPFFRMEKSVISKENVDKITKITGDHIAESILYNICYDHQYNIFGFGHLDPEMFATRFGYGLDYLRKQHEDPYRRKIIVIEPRRPNKTNRLKGRNEQKEEKISAIGENRLENSLFVLANLPLSVNTAIINDEKRIRYKFEPVRIFKSFWVEQEKQTGKLTYTYELDNGFMRNLANHYLKSNTNSLVNLRKSGLGPLYQHLLRLKDAIFASGFTSTTPENTPSFAYLCKLAGVRDNQEPKYMKRDLNNTLKKIIKETELDFSIEWIKNGNGQKYTPIFHFIPSLGETVGKETRVAQAMRKEERLDVLAIEFRHRLYKNCPYRDYQYMDKAEELFFDWIRQDTPEFRKGLHYLFEDTYVNCGLSIPDNIETKVNTFVRQANLRNSQKFDEWTKELFVDL